MHKIRLSLGMLGLVALLASAQARIITVTTTNNVSPGAGVSLLQALSGLQDGDEVQFNIPGAGPFYIATPAGGYPYITNNNVVIDGYSQPGAHPNTNSILAPNSAQLMIVLDSRNQNVTPMQFEPGNSNDGYDQTEFAILGILRATNVTVRGLCLISTVPDSASQGTLHIYGIAFARDATATSAYGHVSGCWIGVEPDGKTLAGLRYPIASYSYKDASGNRYTTDNLTIGVAKNSTNAPAEFNVIVENSGMEVEGNGIRISGNFLGVLPDGVTEDDVTLNPLFSGDYGYGGAIEIGRGGNNTVIGTDGDGVNDANERNIIVGTIPKTVAPSLGLGDGYDHTIEFYGNSPGTNIVIAGNYIGVGVDGQTVFTNGAPAINASGGSSQYRIGSNFDGVSDELEGNVIYNNWPPDLFAVVGLTSTSDTWNFFDGIGLTTIVSLRGNSLVNNFPFPVSPTKPNNGNPDEWVLDYYAPVLMTTNNGVAPVLSTNTTLTRLVGTAPLANTNTWPKTVIDLYAADYTGITNGQSAGIPELPNGFVQGSAYIGSFWLNSTNNRAKTPGAFDFDLSAVNVKGSNLTVTASYVNTNNTVVLTSPFSEPAAVTFVPGSLEALGLHRIVPDTVVTNPMLDSLGNWEPYTSMMGDSTFLISCGAYAPDQTPPVLTATGMLDGSGPYQNPMVYLQPAAGGQGKVTMEFYTDAGAPFGGPIVMSRQNGNPPRVAGDQRPGATNYLTMAEASPGQIQVFNSDTRWSSNLIYQADNRYVTVQPFSLNPTTLVATPLHDAFDAIYGDYVDSSTTPGGGNQVSRAGGTAVFLDNGNIAVVIDDKTTFSSTAGEVTTAAIVTPTGKVVKDHWLVDPHDIWDNVAPCQGGFCVRVHNLLYFYDDAGNLKGSVDQATSGETFDAGRGDGTRIGGHINSPYVYLIGKVTTANVVRIAVFDSRTQTFVAKTDASEGAFVGGFDRADIAVDALNRVTATWVSQPAGYTQQQVAARVLAFDSTNKVFNPLTPSFFAFINFSTNSISTYGMNVSMTTRQIMVAAKGQINLENTPAAGPDSNHEINFFTVFAHPAPANDPTPPVGGGGLKIVSVTASAAGTSVTLSWSGGSGPYNVQSKAALSAAQWQSVTNTTQTSVTVPIVGRTGFFRVSQ